MKKIFAAALLSLCVALPAQAAELFGIEFGAPASNYDISKEVLAEQGKMKMYKVIPPKPEEGFPGYALTAYDGKVVRLTAFSRADYSNEGTDTRKIFASTVEKLNKVGEKMASNGYSFFLHNHHYEFMKMTNGELIFDYILENAPYINFTLDTYWLQFAGVDVLKTIEKLKGRIGCVHLKDYRIVVNKKLDYFDCTPAYESVGDGNMDFKAIVPKMKEAGTEHFLVEHDNAASLPDPLGCVERSIRYIQAEL